MICVHEPAIFANRQLLCVNFIQSAFTMIFSCVDCVSERRNFVHFAKLSSGVVSTYLTFRDTYLVKQFLNL